MSNERRYDPDSVDSTLSRIIANQEAAARKQDAILDQVTRTNGRVLKLENWRDQITTKVSAVSAAVAAGFSGLLWLLKYYVAKLF